MTNNTELNRLIEEMVEATAQPKYDFILPNQPDFRKGFKSGALAALQSPEVLQAAGLVKQEWVSIKTRLPEVSDGVEEFYDEVLTLQVGRKRPTFMKYWEVKHCPFTTHWMKLPEPPVSDKPITIK